MMIGRARKRPVLAFCMTVVLVAAVGGPASAGQLIIYRGETSAGEVVAARVLRRDSGRRLLTKIGFQRLVVSCEEGPGDEFGVVWVFGTPAPRLAENGSFSIDEHNSLVTGRFRWARGDGTIEISYLQDGGTCTTGELTWTVARTRSLPVTHPEWRCNSTLRCNAIHSA
jgi:hypothetical protein